MLRGTIYLWPRESSLDSLVPRRVSGLGNEAIIWRQTSKTEGLERVWMRSDDYAHRHVHSTGLSLASQPLRMRGRAGWRDCTNTVIYNTA